VKKNPFRPFAIVIGLLVCGLAGFRLWQLWEQPADAFWTQPAYAPTLDAVSDRFAVLVDGEPVLKLVKEQKLLLVVKETPAPVTAERLTVSVNNYDKVRASRIPAMIVFAAVAGGAFILFLVGLFTPLIGSFHPQELVDLHLPT
jgi:hypothetical protein